MATTLAESKPNRKVLEPDSWDLWLKSDPDAAAALMKPANEDALVSRPVSKAVGNRVNERTLVRQSAVKRRICRTTTAAANRMH
jgi:putative SOS response-associated peptidase YedK